MTTEPGTIKTRLDISRRELLDLGLRNPLLNHRPLRARGVEVVEASSSAVFQALVRERKAMWFAPKLSAEAGHMVSQSEGMANSRAARQGDLKLQTAVPADQLQTRLLNTYYAARTHIEERGANILYLALGALYWYEAPQSQEARRAPLLLVPVQLDRATVGSRFQATYTDEDVEDNLSLAAKLQREFGLTLPELPDADDLNVTAYFDEIARAIQDEPRWRIEHDSVALGFFSFGKFMMYRDLDTSTWPEGAHPTAHPVLQALLGDGFREPPSPYSDVDNVDLHLTPAESPQVVDADSSQTLALLSVRSGRNLVIQGPPGTGKSQTITNLIAEAIDRGQTVLFVAEKLAALEVVKRRLDAIGLGDACLELHSQKAHKATVIRDLANTLELGRPRVDDHANDLVTLGDLRARLNAYSEAMNTPVAETSLTPHQALGALLQIHTRYQGVALPRLLVPRAAWTAAEYSRRDGLVEHLQACLAAVTVPHDHVFWQTRRTSLTPIEHGRVRGAVATAATTAMVLSQSAGTLAGLLGIATEPASRVQAEAVLAAAQRVLAAPDLAGFNLRRDLWQRHEQELQEALAARAQLSTLHGRYDTMLRPEVWDEDLVTTRETLQAYQGRWWRVFSGSYRRARRKAVGIFRTVPPSDPTQLAEAIDAIIDARRQQQTAEQLDHIGVELLGARWHDGANWAGLIGASGWVIELFRDIDRGQTPAEIVTVLAGQSNWDQLVRAANAVAADLTRHHDAVRAAVDEMGLLRSETADDTAIGGQSFAQQEMIFAEWASGISILHAIVAAKAADAQCRADGLGDVANLATSWPDASTHLLAAWRRAALESIIERAYAERPPLSSFDAMQHTEAIARFRDLDRNFFDFNRARLAFHHWQNLPRHEAGGQLGVLRREFEKKARHLPVRQLMRRAGHAIQALKPVFMMSPLSVATFLPQGDIIFDLVIFDEASQVKPVDALGAIARGRQVVVVGDNKQLPPTSFFDTMLSTDDLGEDDESITEDIESILGLFAAQGAPEQMLRWHYRSRHESLIAVSNSEFYNHRLVVFPSPDAGREHLGLVFRHLPHTAYDRGRSRANVKEAEAVAQAVMSHARQTAHLTLGVAAFSVAQMQAVLDQLELLRRADPSTEDFFSSHGAEPFFVKNLETVQGDERDVIFISIGYGRTAEGYLAMDFGPLNRVGGERRLNVLITRARQRCEVFTNITADDIDLSRTQARGVAALKTFLAYAQHGRLDVPIVSDRPMDSPFEEAVAMALTTRGYTVRAQVGSTGFFIDLAIVDPERPGRYLLGIECDGATYHSARSARDRDRLRQQVLEGLGWRLHRIWSTDWFRDPDREMDRMVMAIESARQQDSDIHAMSTNTAEIDVTVEREDVASQSTDTSVTVPYERAILHIMLGMEGLHEVSRLRIADWIRRVVAVESPVHENEVARRIVEAAGIKRIGNRIEEAFQLSVLLAVQNGMVCARGEFLWDLAMALPPLRDRSRLPAASRKLEYVAPEEIALAVEAVVEGTYGIEDEAIAPAVGQVLGFGRVSDEMRSRIESVVRQMIMEKRLIQQGTHVVMRKEPA